MAEIITSIGTVITGFSTWFSSIATALISNDLVLLIVGLGVAGITFGFVMSIVSKLRANRSKKK